jgi:hypothetical protein
MNGRSVLLGGGACVAVLSGCSASLHIGDAPTDAPDCTTVTVEHPARLSGPLVLTAQSVPTATRIPCLHALPAGWTFHDMQAREGRTRIRLDDGDDNDAALTVTLTRTCDVRAAKPMIVARSGARQYEQIEQRDSQGYLGVRYLVFPGGCVNEQFDIHGGAPAAAAATISRSVGLVTRSAIRRYVREYSDGRIELDPRQEQ